MYKIILVLIFRFSTICGRNGLCRSHLILKRNVPILCRILVLDHWLRTKYEEDPVFWLMIAFYKQYSMTNSNINVCSWNLKVPIQIMQWFYKSRWESLWRRGRNLRTQEKSTDRKDNNNNMNTWKGRKET